MSLPLAPQFQWLTTAETIQIHFQADYFTGPAPDGHEVQVWEKTGAASPSTTTALSHYFPLSTLNATVEGLLPNTEYFLYVRANGTHFANNQGSWVRREVKTRPLGKSLASVLHTNACAANIYTTIIYGIFCIYTTICTVRVHAM